MLRGTSGVLGNVGKNHVKIRNWKRKFGHWSHVPELINRTPPDSIKWVSTTKKWLPIIVIKKKNSICIFFLNWMVGIGLFFLF